MRMFIMHHSLKIIFNNKVYKFFDIQKEPLKISNIDFSLLCYLKYSKLISKFTFNCYEKINQLKKRSKAFNCQVSDL